MSKEIAPGIEPEKSKFPSPGLDQDKDKDNMSSKIPSGFDSAMVLPD